jgi:hypothetical protein
MLSVFVQAKKAVQKGMAMDERVQGGWEGDWLVASDKAFMRVSVQRGREFGLMIQIKRLEQSPN